MGDLKLVGRRKTNNSRKKQTGGMFALIEINRLLRNCTSLAEVYDKVIEIVTGFLDAEAAGIILYSEATNELVLQKTAFGVSQEELIKYPLILITGARFLPYFHSEHRQVGLDRVPQRTFKLVKSSRVLTQEFSVPIPC